MSASTDQNRPPTISVSIPSASPRFRALLPSRRRDSRDQTKSPPHADALRLHISPPATPDSGPPSSDSRDSFPATLSPAPPTRSRSPNTRTPDATGME